MDTITPRKQRLVGALALGVVALLALLAIVLAVTSPSSGRKVRTPPAIMGTQSRLIAVGEGDHADEALDAAEKTLRRIESRMSTWLEDSEISAFNRAPAGEPVALSASTREVLRAAREFHAATGGAFDATVRPLIELWRETPGAPSEEARKAARAASDWSGLEITATGAIKTQAGVRVDLGGIAKGHAIDRAVAAMKETGIQGGLVDVGGDLRAFGRTDHGGPWRVAIRNPSTEGAGSPIGAVTIDSGAVCTSGDYFRPGHIIDPRTAMPPTRSRSVTVIGPTALAADVWATALAILGPNGLQQLPEDLDAFVIDKAGGCHQTAGFARYWLSAPDCDIATVTRGDAGP